MDVSIIIVNYNTLALTKQTILSVQEFTKDLSYEIILVDNDSQDGSVEYFSKFDGIRFVAAGENLGFGKGNNLGVSLSSGKFVFLLNSDTILRNNAIKYLMDFYSNNRDALSIGAIGCVLEDLIGNEILSKVPFKSIGNYLEIFRMKFAEKILGNKCKVIKYPKDDFFEVDAVIGADMFLTRELYNQINGFDENFFLYGEEVELQKRIHDLGFKNYLIRSARIVHLEGGSSDNKANKLSVNTLYRLKEGEFKYIKKHYNSFYYYFYCLIQLFTYYPWILLSSRFNNEIRARFLKLLRN